MSLGNYAVAGVSPLTHTAYAVEYFSDAATIQGGTIPSYARSLGSVTAGTTFQDTANWSSPIPYRICVLHVDAIGARAVTWPVPIGRYKKKLKIVMIGDSRQGGICTGTTSGFCGPAIPWQISGTVSAPGGATTLTGVGTHFLTECLPSRILKIGASSYTISSIADDTHLTTSTNISVVSGVTATIQGYASLGGMAAEIVNNYNADELRYMELWNYCQGGSTTEQWLSTDTTINFGASGSPATFGTTKILWSALTTGVTGTAANNILAAPPDADIVIFGDSADCVLLPTTYNVATFITQRQALIAQIKTYFTTAKILLQLEGLVYPYDGGISGGADTTNDGMTLLMQATLGVGPYAGSGLIDGVTVFAADQTFPTLFAQGAPLVSSSLSADGLHPVPAVYLEIARGELNAIDRLLSQPLPSQVQSTVSFNNATLTGTYSSGGVLFGSGLDGGAN